MRSSRAAWLAVSAFFVFVLALVVPGPLLAQAPVGPDAAIAAARQAAKDTARGAHLRVVLLTVGPGEDITQRFGHNMLWIRDDRNGDDLAWNWGLYSFQDPAFVVRFLFGHTKYLMGAMDAQAQLNEYHEMHRGVVAQELALTPGQRNALDAFVRVNQDSANRTYRYDYFLDNCSTRIRDALDIVLGGAIRTALEPLSAEPISYRSEALRLNVDDPWMFLGMDFALGVPADRPLDPWRAGFIPMRLRDALRRVWVKAEDGTSVPLVKNERVLMESDSAPEPAEMQSGNWPRRVMIGTLVLTLIIVGLGMLSRRGVTPARPAIVGIAVILHLLWGLLATLVVFMWLFTLHWAWRWNVHLLMFTPASLVIAVQVIRQRNRWKAGNWIEVYHFVVAAISFSIVIGTLVWYRLSLTPTAGLVVMWANLSWMLHFALGSALARLPGGHQMARPLAE